jgi:DNA-binding Lrp family transcriptional regulator
MDNLDRRIIDQLRQNSRAAYGDIGGVIGLSASAVKLLDD